MLYDSEDTEQIIERVAALDIGKAEVVAYPGAQPGQSGTPGAGDRHLFDDDPTTAGIG